jgi:formamidopyrimidine-DNA glycosylase
MPELPEVETIVRELRKKIKGLKITDAWVDWPKTVKQAGGIESFKKQVKNKKINSVQRRAKYVVINIGGPKTIFIHQKISGHLLFGKWELKNGVWASKLKGPLREDRRNGYIRFILFLNNGYQLALSDLRRFAKVMLVDDSKLDQIKSIKSLGPEPLDISFNDFKSLFLSKRGKIKQVLMDQTFIAGIGNIYSDEILWDAGLHPLSRVEKLEIKDLRKLFVSVVKILKRAILYKGDSIDDYRLPSGEMGGYQSIQRAYHQTGKKCFRKDGGVIHRIRVNQRSAHFCQKHQKLVE